MAYQLTPEQKEYYKDVKANMSKHVQIYKDKKAKELKEGKRDELKKELENLLRYVKGCEEGRISDFRTKITFNYRKAMALKELLEE